MILIRRLLGDVLRRKRQDEGRTLRQLAAEARISPGYLSEIERGQKEPSSELLAAICDALDVRLSDLLREVSIDLAAAELAAALEAERIGVAMAGKVLPGARVGAAPVVKSVPLTKSIVRTGARPGARPAPRPVTRRVPPVAANGQLPAAVLAQAMREAGRLADVPLGALGPVTSVGLPIEADSRLVTIPLVNLGDLALR